MLDAKAFDAQFQANSTERVLPAGPAVRRPDRAKLLEALGALEAEFRSILQQSKVE